MKLGWVALVLVLGLCGGADAALLGPAQVDAARLLPPPPAEGSDTARGELAELHAIADAATPQMLAAAARDANDQKPDMFNAVLGFDVTQYPAVLKLLREAGQESNTGAAKRYFHRPRPWQADPSIKTCVSRLLREGNDSYPSGHTTYGYTLGVVLAALLPAQAPVILARAADFAHNRMVCGFHYRSDTVGGQAYGTAVGVELMGNPIFKADFDAAAAELAARK